MIILQLEKLEHLSKFEGILNRLMEQGTQLGIMIIKALIIFLVGRFVIGLINKLVKRVLVKRDIDPSIRSFLGSLVNVVLTVLLIISVVGALGVQTTSFAALLASVGVAIGMALSGNLSNFAGGLIVLLFKPYRVGDYIEVLNTGGTVKEIQIFHTVLTTADGKTVFIPNGSASSGLVTNYNVPTRRIEWIFNVEYGCDYNQVKQIVESVIAKDSRVLPEPAPFIALHALASSSVNVVARSWVKASDYWDVYFDINKIVYETFNAEGISFPFPQLTIHHEGKES